MSRLKERYSSEIKPTLVEEFEIKNPMQIPAIEKVVISVGAGEAGKDNNCLLYTSPSPRD